MTSPSTTRPTIPTRSMTTLALALTLSMLPGAGTTALAEGQRSLVELEREIARDYPTIGHVTPDELKAVLERQPEKVLLLDARGAGEIAVSRLPGAYEVDPEIGVDAFLERFGALVAGREVLIYCTVGVRSSRLATRLGDALLKRGATRVANLQGGIFALHNGRRPLVDTLGKTEWVHPYSSRWTYYLDRKDLSRFTPRTADGERQGGTQQNGWWRLLPH